MDELLGDADLCFRFGAGVARVAADLKVGLANDVSPAAHPINGLRHRPGEGTSGWFIWCGEGGPSQADDYFEPVHAAHLQHRLPAVVPYLALAPGWRFLIALGHEDVWFDPSLLGTE